MLKLPSEFVVLWITVKDPSDWGTSARGASTPFRQSFGSLDDPAAVHRVLIQLPLIVPAGVTLHIWEARPPSLDVAVIVNPPETRDCADVGVQERVLPLNAAPCGAPLSANVTVPPAGSVAVTV